MLDQNKVRLMTKLAMYEQNEGKYDIEMMNYYKSDYVSLKVFKINLSITIFLILIFIANVAIYFINSLENFKKMDILFIGSIYLVTWIVFMIISTYICSRIYKKRYIEASSRINKYEKMLNELQRMQ